MNNPNDLISRAVAVAIADTRLSDVPDHVDLEDDRNLFAAGYLAAAGSIRAALQRATSAATAPETPVVARECAEEIEREIFRLGGLARSVVFNADSIEAIITRYLVGTPLPECEHEWIDARNEVITDGEWCSRCGAIRAGNAATVDKGK